MNTANLVFLPLEALGIVCIAQLLGGTAESAPFAGSTLLLAPVNIYQSTTTCVDTAYAPSAAAFLAAGLYACIRPRGEMRAPWEAAPMLDDSLGLMIGAKTSGLGLGALGLVAITVLMALKLRGPTGQRRARCIRQNAALLLATVAVATAVRGHWYIRNLVIAGNPLYRVEVAVAGYTLFPGVPFEQAVVLNMRMVPAVMRSWPASD